MNNKIVLKRKQHVSIKKYQQTASIAGFIKKSSLEIIPGATVYIPALYLQTIILYLQAQFTNDAPTLFPV